VPNTDSAPVVEDLPPVEEATDTTEEINSDIQQTGEDLPADTATV
jgi:hypothetical protein